MIATTFTTLLTIISTTTSSCASASSDDEEKVYVKGVATLQSGITIINDNDTNNNPNNKNAALYVTARPNKADNVPRAILDGSNGRPPPVLSARYPNPTFPFEFRLTSQNYTPEGASSIIEVGNNDDDNNNNGVWWEDEDLIISARLDTDGVAATRDPTDLVGRGLYIKKKMDENDNNNEVSIELQGRGLFGKSVTAKK